MSKGKRKKAERSLRWDAAKRLLRLAVGKDVDVYDVREIRADDGTLLGCRLDKHGDTEGDGPYDVELATGTCHCRGNLRWGTCKHVDAIRKLVALNKVAS